MLTLIDFNMKLGGWKVTKLNLSYNADMYTKNERERERE